MSQKLKWLLLIIILPLYFSWTCYASEVSTEQLFSKTPPKGSLIDSSFWSTFMHTSQLKVGQIYLYKGSCIITDSKGKLLAKAESNLNFIVNQERTLTAENSTEFNCLNSSAAEINIFMSSIELMSTLRQNCETIPPDYLNTIENFIFSGISELNICNTKQKTAIILIENKDSSGNTTDSITQWYCPGYGLVKQVIILKETNEIATVTFELVAIN